jgi:hypothetical protein
MKFIDNLIPPFLKKLDRYLMVNHPNIWVTNLHFVVFYTVILDLILFGLASIGSYSVSGKSPDAELAAGLMILPAVIIFIFWFIKQARYNVDKNYGRSHVGHDLLNFMAYMLCCICFASVVIVVPITIEAKYSNVISPEELHQDADVLNLAYCFFEDYNHYNSYGVERVNGKIKVQRDLYLHLYDYDSDYYGNDYLQPHEGLEREEYISEEQAIQEISNFIHVYERYGGSPMGVTPQEVLAMALDEQAWDLNHMHNYSYYDEPQYKLERISRLQQGQGFSLGNDEMLKALFGLFGFLSLMVWMFKQVHWQNYLALVIAGAALPLLGGLIFLFVDQVIGLSHGNEEAFIFVFIVIVHLFTIIFLITTWIGKTYSPAGVVMGLINQIWLPFCFSFYLLIYVDMTWNYESYGYGWDTYGGLLDMSYWIGWIVCIGSILLLKPYYKRMLNMPRKK